MALQMPYRLLGRTGLKVSALSLGSWVTFGFQVGNDAAYKMMKHAFEKGINFFDNAEVYANGDSERIMGDVIKRGVKDGVWTRDELVITTKLFFGVRREGKTKKAPNAIGCSRKHLIEGLDASLKRLQLDYVDVVFCHRQDPDTPLEETVRAMNHLIARGMAFYWGTSEWSAQAITEACEIAERLKLIPPCCEQPQYNVLWRDRVEVEYAPLYDRFGTGLTIFSPLMNGVLTGKYSKGIPEGSRLSLPDFAWLKAKMTNPEFGWIKKSDQFVAMAQELKLTPAQLAIGWCLKNPQVSTVILGASTEEQLDENLSALEALPTINEDVLARLNGIFGAPTYDQTLSSSLAMRRGEKSIALLSPKTVIGRSTTSS